MAYLRKRKKPPEQPASASGQLMALSLFIMLLAFFIVLNSLSAFEDTKVVPILDNLQQTFTGSRIEGEDDKPAMIPEEEDNFLKAGNSLDRIEGLFKAQISNFEASKSQFWGVMHIRLELEEFRRAVMALEQFELQPDMRIPEDGNFFLPTLVSVLRAEDLGTPYHMEIMVNLSQSPGAMYNRDPQTLRNKTDEVGILARTLEQAGLEASRVNAGLRQGDKGMVDLFFKPYMPFDPLAGLEPQAGGENTP